MIFKRCFISKGGISIGSKEIKGLRSEKMGENLRYLVGNFGVEEGKSGTNCKPETSGQKEKKSELRMQLSVPIRFVPSKKCSIEITGNRVCRSRLSPTKDYVYQTEQFIVRVGLGRLRHESLITLYHFFINNTHKNSWLYLGSTLQIHFYHKL